MTGYPNDYSTVDHPSVETDDRCPECGAETPAECAPGCDCTYCAEKCRNCRTPLFPDERARGTCRRCYADALALAAESGDAA